MSIYLAGNLVRDMMTAELNRPVAQVILRNFIQEAALLRDRSTQFDEGPILEGAELILHLPAGLAHSNFVDSRTRKTFQKAVAAASKIRGMVHYGVVYDWDQFVELCEELSGYLERIPARNG